MNLNYGSFPLASNEEAEEFTGANGWTKIEIPKEQEDELVSSVTLKLSNFIAASISVEATNLSYNQIEMKAFSMIKKQ